MNPFRKAIINRAMQKESDKFTDTLQPVPDSDWPIELPVGLKEVWRSKTFLLMVYDEANRIERLSVVRTTLGNGNRWADGITWDELQRLKNECGRGDKFAVEIYPADTDIVNVSNMRHLWVLLEPPEYAWRKETLCDRRQYHK